MPLDDFHMNENDRMFFKQAAKMIYKWLPPHKKMKLNLELASEGLSGIMDLEDKDRFFRLVNFLEVNYVRVEEWMDETHRCLQKLNNMQKDNQIADIEIELDRRRKVRVSGLVEELRDLHPKEIFHSTLKDLKLEAEYRRHFERKVGGIQTESGKT